MLYKYLSNNINFKLDRLAFAYGNIKPDFMHKDIKCNHTLDESLDCVNKYSEHLMKDNLSIKEFSERLGIICHFVCDYFCIYHRDGNEDKGVFEHTLYEINLHFKLITLLIKKKLRLNNHDMPEISIEATVLKLEKKYNTEANSLTRDINYSLNAAIQTSKLIIYSSQLYFEKNEKCILEENILENL
jgi:hypothetical protein